MQGYLRTLKSRAIASLIILPILLAIIGIQKACTKPPTEAERKWQEFHRAAELEAARRDRERGE